MCTLGCPSLPLPHPLAPPASPTCVQNNDKAFLNNHLSFTILYHKVGGRCEGGAGAVPQASAGWEASESPL